MTRNECLQKYPYPLRVVVAFLLHVNFYYVITALSSKSPRQSNKRELNSQKVFKDEEFSKLALLNDKKTQGKLGINKFYGVAFRG